MRYELRSGILVADKPEGMTSARLISKIKRWTSAKKVGHTGVLDPFATGVMICCLNQATRISQFFLNGDKVYDAVIRLGIETDTQDLTGQVVSEQSTAGISKEEIIRTVLEFRGTIDQFPPVYSALKHNGKPLYRLARQGTPVQKPSRKITVYDIKILSVNMPDVHIRVSCSKGTYIRTLSSDMGRALGCGAHLKSLRRVESCGFKIDRALSIQQIEKMSGENALFDSVISMNDALKNIPECVVGPSVEQKIRFGRTVLKNEMKSPYVDSDDGTAIRPIKIVNADRQLLAIFTDKKLNFQYDYCCVFNNDNAEWLQ